MAEEKSTQLTIALPRFDGPFDLLLSLIRRNEWSIDDLPVVEITAQFLDYIRAARDLDAELAGEFVETASWLVLLKSRSMLPVDEADGPTPREELRRAVLDHAKLAATTEFLRDRYEGNLKPASAGARPGRQNPVLPPSSEEDPTVEDVLEAVRRATEAARAAASFRGADHEDVTVESQISWISNQLVSIPINVPVSTVEWFAVQTTAAAKAALLLALLELARKGLVLLHQQGQCSSIRIKAMCEIPVNIDTDAFSYAGASMP
jgi:segregation and condensation protein A